VKEGAHVTQNSYSVHSGLSQHGPVGCRGPSLADASTEQDDTNRHEPGPPLVHDPLSIERVEWDNPYERLYTDITNEVSPDELARRYGVTADAMVPGAGEVVGIGCMAGSDTGVEAVVVYRRDGNVPYTDYIIAEGGAAFDWPEWFAATQPDTPMRPSINGWTSEPLGASDGRKDQPVWGPLAGILQEANGW